MLNNPQRKSPATCHSGPKLENRSGPSPVMSPSVKESQTTADQIASGSMPSDLPTRKEEPQVQPQQVKSEASTPKLESLMTDVKEEVDELDNPGQGPDALPEEILGVADNQPLDSEDSLSQEHVASELRRLNELRVSATLAEMRVGVAGDSNQNPEEGAVAPVAEESTAPRPLKVDKEPLLQTLNGTGRTMKLMHHKDQIDSVEDYDLQIRTCLVPPSGYDVILKQVLACMEIP